MMMMMAAAGNESNQGERPLGALNMLSMLGGNNGSLAMLGNMMSTSGDKDGNSMAQMIEMMNKLKNSGHSHAEGQLLKTAEDKTFNITVCGTDGSYNPTHPIALVDDLFIEVSIGDIPEKARNMILEALAEDEENDNEDTRDSEKQEQSMERKRAVLGLLEEDSDEQEEASNSGESDAPPPLSAAIKSSVRVVMALPKNRAAKRKVLKSVSDGASRSTFTTLSKSMPSLERSDVNATAVEATGRRLAQADKSNIDVKVMVMLNNATVSEAGGARSDGTSVDVSGLQKSISTAMKNNKENMTKHIERSVKAMVISNMGSSQFDDYKAPTVAITNVAVQVEETTPDNPGAENPTTGSNNSTSTVNVSNNTTDSTGTTTTRSESDSTTEVDGASQLQLLYSLFVLIGTLMLASTGHC